MSPAELCRKVNGVLSGNVVQGRFVTFFYGVIDTNSNRLVYTCAGHNPPVLLHSDGTEERLGVGGTVLGLFPSWSYEQAEIELSIGDRLVLCTDGVIEAVNSADEEFGEARLVAVMKNATNKSSDQLQKAIIAAVTEHSRGNFHDDVTLLIVQVRDRTFRHHRE